MTVRRRLVLVFATTLALAGCGSASDGDASPKGTGAQAPGPVPASFFGITAPELQAADADLAQAFDAQAKAGIGLIRQPMYWYDVEPTQGKYTWAHYDRFIGRAAQSGITVLPLLFGTPKWARAAKKKGVRITDTTTMPPRDPAQFARFTALAVQRYGANGAFWKANPSLPKLPIQAWQVWNEPNLPPYWGGKPDPKAYAKLLIRASAAIRRNDPAATVVTGGVPESRLGLSIKTFVRGMTKAGAAKSFDALAVHPYADSADGVLANVRKARKAAIAGGAKNPSVWITEVGWATGGPGRGFTVTEAGQAQLVTELIQKAVAQRASLHLDGLVYYAWRDAPPYQGGKDFWGLHTGLVNLDNSVKPGLSAFAAAVKAARGQ